MLPLPMADKKAHPDQRYVDAIRDHDSAIIRELYRRFSEKVIRYVQKNNGSGDDARDIIQEALITIYRQATTEQLVLTCPFDAYFFLICRRKWINKLKEKRGVTISDDTLSIADGSDEAATETLLHDSKTRLLEDKFNELGEKCREVLTLSMQLQDMEAVAKALQVSYAYVRKKKSLCMGQLTSLIRNSEEYKGLL